MIKEQGRKAPQYMIKEQGRKALNSRYMYCEPISQGPCRKGATKNPTTTLQGQARRRKCKSSTQALEA
jgi:hypothetical protein